MNQEKATVGDKVKDSPAGPGTVTSFDTRGYAIVDGVTVGWYVREDGKKYGPMGELTYDEAPKGEKVEPLSTMGTASALKPVKGPDAPPAVAVAPTQQVAQVLATSPQAAQALTPAPTPSPAPASAPAAATQAAAAPATVPGRRVPQPAAASARPATASVAAPAAPTAEPVPVPAPIEAPITPTVVTPNNPVDGAVKS